MTQRILAAADSYQVDRGLLVFGKLELVSQGPGQQRRPQYVLHRQPEPQVDSDGKRRQDLGSACTRPVPPSWASMAEVWHDYTRMSVERWPRIGDSAHVLRGGIGHDNFRPPVAKREWQRWSGVNRRIRPPGGGAAGLHTVPACAVGGQDLYD
jgi:hypothetical protein